MGATLRKALLKEEAIITAARKFYELHEKLPSSDCKDSVPGMPEESWRKLDAAGLSGIRGLKKGRSLRRILEPLRGELGFDAILTEESILVAARRFYEMHGHLPNRRNDEPVPGMPFDT